MKRDGNGLRLSASDLMRFMACSHATRLDLAFLAGQGPQPTDDGEDAVLLQRYGDAHEAAHLAQLERSGARIIRIEKDGVAFDEAIKATLEALRQGPDVVFQGALEGGMWGGYSDFLERVDLPSKLGGFSYEVADTKLKRKPAPAHVLQLVLYSDLLAAVQGRSPERAHVELGDGKRFSFRLAEYAAYARSARERLESFVVEPTKTRALPCAICSLCRWREHCAGEWEQEDSLFRVAGITKAQVQKFEATGITTMATLAQQHGHVPKMAEATLEKLRTQAALQQERKGGEPSYALRPPLPGKGFDLMPRPDPGDLYYDIEGDPFYAESGAEGLEYLHGVWDGKTFNAFWAHDLAEEKEALVALFALFEHGITQNPGAHIYHYASYEITALRKLTSRHGVGEAQLDRWLRERRFIDLYAVVRGGVYASEPSYSIKDMDFTIFRARAR
ncbi:TM0106 family RecB-like putative nuclease [Mesorhizobium sp.]|uniref:TM0106 family RecB-like putative nuclease n=1 Tax=Mesorhizobium sp. TaxID=1871066 RepID=UPI0025F91356|nr:TM0106 family RecB-like putative nuclease [Mesorhizobium sp.]